MIFLDENENSHSFFILYYDIILIVKLKNNDEDLTYFINFFLIEPFCSSVEIV